MSIKNVFVIGGTGFVGPPLIQQLTKCGHDVTYLHRGETHDSRTDGAREVIADRKDESRLAAAIAMSKPDIVVDMIPFTADDALAVRRACCDSVQRIVALSSIDVYLAFGRIHETEPGPVQPTPLTELSSLRQTNQPGGPTCDKIAVEQTYLSEVSPPATILRLPAIYGARDKYRRLRGYLKRMDDGRPFILLGESIAKWKFSRGYVENVAHAISLAVQQDCAAGEIYNVAEPQAMTEADLVHTIARTTGWQGDVITLPDGYLPEYLKPKVNFAQDWEVCTRKIREQLGYSEIVNSATAFERTVDWERSSPPEAEPFEYDDRLEDQAFEAAATSDRT
ncbi:MAG: NAD-dependent epimerase/dehydratase family protein [Planctomycetaceae bacterium]|nr:NAD-dependent epimerase/dehydratase family protein [Planctomycetaceae bacterium]